jgi:hypothetical protein
MVTLSRYWMAPGWSWLNAFWKLEKILKQAGAELCQAQEKLGLKIEVVLHLP